MVAGGEAGDAPFVGRVVRVGREGAGAIGVACYEGHGRGGGGGVVVLYWGEGVVVGLEAGFGGDAGVARV